jgi:hypothetical protein
MRLKQSFTIIAGAGLSQVPTGGVLSVDGVSIGWASCFDAKRCLLWRTRFVISTGWLYDDSSIGVEDRCDRTTTVSASAGGGARAIPSIYIREIISKIRIADKKSMVQFY